MIVSAILALIVVGLIMLIPHPSALLENVLFFALGLITSSQVLTYSVVAESNPSSITASAESIAATIIMFGGFAQGLFGWLMGLFWAHSFTSQHLPLYSIDDYRRAMLILPIGFVLSLVCAFLLKESRTYTTA